MFGHDLAWWLCVTIRVSRAAVYVGTVFGLYALLDYFFGQDVADKVVIVYGFPVALTWTIGRRIKESIVAVATWPWRHRRQRLFREFFGFEPREDPWDSYESQDLVDTKLTELALEMQQKFDEEVRARERWRRDRSMDVSVYIWSAKNAKSKFWLVPRIVHKCGYDVRISYRDYLSSAVDSFQEEAGVVEEESLLPSECWRVP